MDEQQAMQISKEVKEEFLEQLPIFYDGADRWEILYENELPFRIHEREFVDGSIQLGINLKHCYNKFSDCPIICCFPKNKKEWKVLFEAMNELLNDSYPKDCCKKGSYLWQETPDVKLK